MKKLLFTAFTLIVIVMILQTNSVHASQTVLVYHGKNTVESPTQFTGTTMHFVMSGDKATVINFGQKGMEVIRMDIKPSDACIQTVLTLCFDGKVTNVKNQQIHHVGDEVSFTLDFANKKQIATVKSGTLRGTTIIMNIDRMSIQSDAPYTISVSREGGFAALPPKTITFDSSSGVLSLVDRNSNSTNVLDKTMIQQINGLVHKARLLNVVQQQYSPHSGAADYFTYHMMLDQGIFHKEFSWTDASDAPKSLSELTQSLMYLAKPDN